MKRMNFPHRKIKRREEALLRAEAYAKRLKEQANETSGTGPGGKSATGKRRARGVL